MSFHFHVIFLSFSTSFFFSLSFINELYRNYIHNLSVNSTQLQHTGLQNHNYNLSRTLLKLSLSLHHQGAFFFYKIFIHIFFLLNLFNIIFFSFHVHSMNFTVHSSIIILLWKCYQDLLNRVPTRLIFFFKRFPWKILFYALVQSSYKKLL